MVFANHLLIDALVSLVPELGMILIVNQHTICPSVNAFSASSCCTLQVTYPVSEVLMQKRSMVWHFDTRTELVEDCQLAVTMIRVMLILLTMILTGVQCRLSMKIRNFASKLEL